MAKKKAKKKSSPPSHNKKKVIIGLPSPTNHSSLPLAANSAAADKPLAIDPAQPVLTAPPPLSILGKGPITPADDQPHSPMLSSADSSCAEESDDGESSSYASSSSSGDTSDLEPMSAPHSPLVQPGLAAVQTPEQGLSPPASAPNPAEGIDAPPPPAPKDGGAHFSGIGAAIAAKNGGSVANKESIAGLASRVDSAALGSVQPADPMFAEVDAAAGGWEQVRKKHRSNKHSHKKQPLVATANASAGPTVLADKSKSGAVLNGLNSEVDVGLAAAEAFCIFFIFPRLDY
ncbi:hypothetical protein OIU77_015107 [Salix suchowensis]|uniref:Uncharacterized protein n=1 Tax=Salix suchowensis TaxID=1278906 RepID=A0ABQ8ZSK0_9ROSI|nr:hypothetical protein OIU77_015107 [Salix suchowensis]